MLTRGAALGRRLAGSHHRWCRHAAVVLAVLVLLWCLYLAVSIARYSTITDTAPADAAIVLGAAIDNGQPTPVFTQRLQHALALYTTRQVPLLVLTGGIGDGDTLAESEAARQFCLAHGVAADAIAIETASHSTRENLAQARQLLSARGAKRLLIVSDPLHMRRAIAEAHVLGLDAYPSPTPTTRYVGTASRTRFLLRETYYYARFLLRHRLLQALFPSAAAS